jgi:hypothetical protein
MTLKSKKRIVMRHAMTIIDHADHALTAGFDFDTNRIRACIERVFEELFDYASRALDDFASRNAVGNSFRQNANSTHAFFAAGLIAMPS